MLMMTREVILFIQDVVLFILYSQFYFNRHFNKTTFLWPQPCLPVCHNRPCHFYSGPTKSCVLHGFNYYYKSNCICSGLITAYIFESPLSSTLFSFTFFFSLCKHLESAPFPKQLTTKETHPVSTQTRGSSNYTCALAVSGYYLLKFVASCVSSTTVNEGRLFISVSL